MTKVALAKSVPCVAGFAVDGRGKSYRMHASSPSAHAVDKPFLPLPSFTGEGDIFRLENVCIW